MKSRFHLSKSGTLFFLWRKIRKAYWDDQGPRVNFLLSVNNFYSHFGSAVFKLIFLIDRHSIDCYDNYLILTVL